MMNLDAIPDELLEAIKRGDPDFPIGSSDCMIWKLSHSDCQGCEYFPRCYALVIGLEVGAERYGLGRS